MEKNWSQIPPLNTNPPLPVETPLPPPPVAHSLMIHHPFLYKIFPEKGKNIQEADIPILSKYSFVWTYEDSFF